MREPASVGANAKRVALPFALGATPLSSHAAYGLADGWLPWIVLGAIALFVVGVAIRMVLAARFPRNYRAWARERRDNFAKRNERWERAEDEFDH